MFFILLGFLTYLAVSCSGSRKTVRQTTASRTDSVRVQKRDSLRETTQRQKEYRTDQWTEQFALSPPDSLGKQYVRTVTRRITREQGSEQAESLFTRIADTTGEAVRHSEVQEKVSEKKREATPWIWYGIGLCLVAAAATAVWFRFRR